MKIIENYVCLISSKTHISSLFIIYSAHDFESMSIYSQKNQKLWYSFAIKNELFMETLVEGKLE